MDTGSYKRRSRDEGMTQFVYRHNAR